MQAALLTVGDELLDGDTENTNATWLAGELSDRGVSVRRILTVPDDEAVIAESTREYSDAFDAVVVTGGLGGTPDDVTMAGVAAAFDRPLVDNDLAREDIERTLEAIAGDYPDLDVNVEAEASLPEGARPLLNRAGLSPGCVVENVYVLPGIPSEMERMFEDVAGEFDGDAESRFLYTEEPEANLIERLDETRERFGVKVGCYPDREAGHNRLKLTAEDTAALDDAEAWLAENVTLAE
ncbi:competence/damage-inducible protein A [Natronomonas sp. CBA1123]|jgi:molybdenum cofactor synthesis domain-containing protein|uniref:competence/damage-inducible protein A n=1 Tax=Natronomonas sp. CBA1123 TaxID=2668070 RepID=UPI0012EA44C5|nr:competence/damage-inducible protein A [Natronomonas sp. CBA1123]MUV85726.1 competence/damage-inducible protein A [Natronomonas sp. CBA1123]